jgi:hypothetical protein
LAITRCGARYINNSNNKNKKSGSSSFVLRPVYRSKMFWVNWILVFWGGPVFGFNRCK